MIKGESVQAEGTAKASAQGQDPAWYIWQKEGNDGAEQKQKEPKVGVVSQQRSAGHEIEAA